MQVLEVQGCNVNGKAQSWEVGRSSQLRTEHLTIESEEVGVTKDDSSGLGNYGKLKREASFISGERNGKSRTQQSCRPKANSTVPGQVSGKCIRSNSMINNKINSILKAKGVETQKGQSSNSS